MSYNNLIKLAKAKDEPSRSNRALVLPTSLAIGSGMGLGSRYFANEARDIKDEIRNLKSSIPELDPRLKNELDDINAKITRNRKDFEDFNASKAKFEADKNLYSGGHKFSEPHKNDAQYYKDTEDWTKRRMSDLASDHDDLQARAKRVSDSMQDSDDTIIALKNRLNNAKKAQSRAILKGRALGVMGAGLVGGGLIHAMSRPRERG